MAEQLQCLGFEFDAPEKLDCFFADHWERKTLVDLADGVYLRMDVGSDISCWLSVDPEDQSLLDWDMHRDSGLRLPCAFGEALTCDDRGQSGLVTLQLDPGELDIPVTAACPVLAQWPEREEGAPGLVSLAFYCRSLTLDDAAGSVLTAEPEDNVAHVCGAVLQAESIRNPWSGLYYQHLTLDCLGLTLDLYCPEAMLPAMPARGSRVIADCYVTCTLEAGVISSSGGNP